MAHKSVVEELKESEIEYDEQILNDLVLLLHELNFGTEDLEDEWLAYCHNNKLNSSSSIMNEKSFNTFSKYLRTSQSAKMCKKTRSRSKKNINFIHNNTSLKPFIQRPNTKNSKNNDLMNKLLSMKTPSKTKTKTSQLNKSINKNNKNNKIPIVNIHQTPVPKHNNNSYKSRKNEVTNTLNGNLKKTNNININNINININIIKKDYKEKEYRFMHENIDNKEKVMRDRILFIGEQLMKDIINKNNNNNNDLKEEIEYSEIDEISQRECYYLGVILAENENINCHKITVGNIILKDINNKRIKLDISNALKQQFISLFPGQIIAVKGINCLGKEINVEKIYTNASININNPINIMNDNNNMNIDMNEDGILSIMIGCGPFTIQNSLEFEGCPLYDFGECIAKNGTNIIILMGPFTDINNELIKNGDINCSHQEYFLHLLNEFIDKFITNDKKLIIIPSTRDVHHFTCYPQQRYEINDINISEKKNIFFLNNPSEFNINNISFGVNCTDFLWDCNKVCLTCNVSGQERLLSMMSHCINQQNFYPLYPGTGNKALRMDYNQSKYLYMKKKYDLFIMPSHLKEFAKIYHKTKTICINPSFLTRVNSGGKYAMIHIHQSNHYNLNDYTKLIRVDILRV